MAVLRAVVSDKDGIMHELVLKSRERFGGYMWYYGNVPLVVTPARTPEEAVRLLNEELSLDPEKRPQIVSISRAQESSGS